MRGDEWPASSRFNHMLQRELLDGEVFFQLCGVPVIYVRGGKAKIEVQTAEGVQEILGGILPQELAAHLFARDGGIKSLRISHNLE